MDLQLKNEFKRLQTQSPWMSCFRIDGQVYGSGLNHVHDARPGDFFRLVSNPRRVLELGSCQGGGTFQLAKHAGVEEVVGLEGRSCNIEKARLVQRALGIVNVRFIEANLESFDLSSLGRFDAVYCVGLLYHLPSPWQLLAKLQAVSDTLYVNTHYCPIDQANLSINGYEGAKWGEFGFADPLSGLSDWSFWPTLKSLAAMLTDTGFTPEIIDTDTISLGQSPHGTTIVARRTAVLADEERERLLRKTEQVLSGLPSGAGSRICAVPASGIGRVLARLKHAGRRALIRATQKAR